METNIYKELYYHAFHRISDLSAEMILLQKELEEMYLSATEPLGGDENIHF